MQDNNEDVDKSQNHLEGSMAGSQIEAAQEAGETTPSTPTIMHPLSPISDAQSNASDKVSWEAFSFQLIQLQLQLCPCRVFYHLECKICKFIFLCVFKKVTTCKAMGF